MFTADRLQSMMSATFNKNAPKFEVHKRMPFRCTALCARTKRIWQRGNAAKNRTTTLKSLPNDLPNKSSPPRPLDGPKAYLVTYSVHHTAISVCHSSRPCTGGEWSRHSIYEASPELIFHSSWRILMKCSPIESNQNSFYSFVIIFGIACG